MSPTPFPFPPSKEAEEGSFASLFTENPETRRWSDIHDDSTTFSFGDLTPVLQEQGSVSYVPSMFSPYIPSVWEPYRVHYSRSSSGLGEEECSVEELCVDLSSGAGKEPQGSSGGIIWCLSCGHGNCESLFFPEPRVAEREDAEGKGLKKFRCKAYQAMIKIKVINGGQKETFLVSESIISECSTLFKDAEDVQGTIIFEDVLPSTFQTFVTWMYTGRIQDNTNPNSPAFSELVDLWLLAELLQIPKLQNRSMLLMEEQRIILESIPLACVWGVYKVTTAPHPLRSYMAFMCFAGPWRLNVKHKYYPRELIDDLMELIQYQRVRGLPFDDLRDLGGDRFIVSDDGSWTDQVKAILDGPENPRLGLHGR